jgi:hypothetical protein
MKHELSDMLKAGKENGPPLRYSADDAVAAGRKRQRRQRTIFAGAGSAAAVIAVAAAVAVPQIVAGHKPSPALPAAAASHAAKKAFTYPAGDFTGNITSFTVGDLKVTDTVHVTPGYQVAIVVAPGNGTDTIDANGKRHHSANDIGQVVVYRKGVYNPKKIESAAKTSVDGHPAYFQKSLPGKPPKGNPGDFPKHAFDTEASLAWQYGDNAWAVVSAAGRVEPTQQQLAAIASKVTAGAAKPTKVGFKLSYVPGGYELAAAGPSDSMLLSPMAGESYIRLLKGDFPYKGLTEPAQDPFVVNNKQLPMVQLALYPSWYSKHSAKTASCPDQGLCYRNTADGKYVLELSLAGSLPNAESIKMLNSVTFADPTDTGTWFKATDAVS